MGASVENGRCKIYVPKARSEVFVKMFAPIFIKSLHKCYLCHFRCLRIFEKRRFVFRIAVMHLVGGTELMFVWFRTFVRGHPRDEAHSQQKQVVKP